MIENNSTTQAQAYDQACQTWGDPFTIGLPPIFGHEYGMSDKINRYSFAPVSSNSTKDQGTQFPVVDSTHVAICDKIARVIIKTIINTFTRYTSTWHGDFSDLANLLACRMDPSWTHNLAKNNKRCKRLLQKIAYAIRYAINYTTDDGDGYDFVDFSDRNFKEAIYDLIIIPYFDRTSIKSYDKLNKQTLGPILNTYVYKAYDYW